MNKEIELDVGTLVSAIKDDPRLPSPELLTWYKLYNERKIWFDFGVDESTLDYERLIMLWNLEDKDIPVDQRRPIWIYLFNYGGDLNLEYSFIDAIEMSETPVYTVNMGVCASAAADIFICGKKRFMTKTARVMFHQGAAGYQGDAQKVLDAVDDYKKQLDKAKKYVISHTNITSKQYNSHSNNDWWIEADECLKLGVCDTVVSSINEIL